MTSPRHALWAWTLGLVISSGLPASNVSPEEFEVEPENFRLTMALAETERSSVMVSLAELQQDQIPEKARKLYRQAIKLDRKGDLDEAIRAARLAVATSPPFFRAHTALAVGLVKTGELAEAERHLATALELSPYYLPAREIQGIILFQRGQSEQAVSLLEYVIRKGPTRKVAHYYLGLLSVQLGDEVGAGQHFERAEALCRKRFQPLRDLAGALYGHTRGRRSRIP